MENFRSRLASRKHQHEQHQDQQHSHRDSEDVERQKQEGEEEEEKEENGGEKRPSFYKKMIPNVAMLRNGVSQTKFFLGVDKPPENIQLKLKTPSIGNLDKYHTRNIYANRYKETTKR